MKVTKILKHMYKLHYSTQGWAVGIKDTIEPCILYCDT